MPFKNIAKKKNGDKNTQFLFVIQLLYIHSHEILEFIWMLPYGRSSQEHEWSILPHCHTKTQALQSHQSKQFQPFHQQWMNGYQR